MTYILNHKLEQEKRKIGNYLLIVFEDVAFEFFKVEKTQIRKLENFNRSDFSQLSLDLNEDTIKSNNNYIEHLRLITPPKD